MGVVESLLRLSRKMKDIKKVNCYRKMLEDLREKQGRLSERILEQKEKL